MFNSVPRHENKTGTVPACMPIEWKGAVPAEVINSAAPD